MTYSVYELRDPRTDIAGYVGMSRWPKSRFSQHLSVWRGAQIRAAEPLRCWLRSLHADGVKPEMVIVDSHEKECWARRFERDRIAYHIRVENPIANQDGSQVKLSVLPPVNLMYVFQVARELGVTKGMVRFWCNYKWYMNISVFNGCEYIPRAEVQRFRRMHADKIEAAKVEVAV